jgi:hypothetical protein
VNFQRVVVDGAWLTRQTLGYSHGTAVESTAVATSARNPQNVRISAAYPEQPQGSLLPEETRGKQT